MPSWDILICSIVHRSGMLKELLEELDRQLHSHEPGGGGYRTDVKVICWRDNLQTPYGLKIGGMQDYSRADYVCCVDDDDWIAHDYITRITAALAEGPDYVGFPVGYTVDGHPSLPVRHSLKYGCWETRQDMIVRDISEKNPMRRKLATAAHWEGTYGAEERWARRIRELGQVISEIYIPDPMYFYRFRSDDHFNIARAPLTGWPPVPDYPWLTMLGDS